MFQQRDVSPATTTLDVAPMSSSSLTRKRFADGSRANDIATADDATVTHRQQQELTFPLIPFCDEIPTEEFVPLDAKILRRNFARGQGALLEMCLLGEQWTNNNNTISAAQQAAIDVEEANDDDEVDLVSTVATNSNSSDVDAESICDAESEESGSSPCPSLESVQQKACEEHVNRAAAKKTAKTTGNKKGTVVAVQKKEKDATPSSFVAVNDNSADKDENAEDDDDDGGDDVYGIEGRSKKKKAKNALVSEENTFVKCISMKKQGANYVVVRFIDIDLSDYDFERMPTPVPRKKLRGQEVCFHYEGTNRILCGMVADVHDDATASIIVTDKVDIQLPPFVNVPFSKLYRIPDEKTVIASAEEKLSSHADVSRDPLATGSQNPVPEPPCPPEVLVQAGSSANHFLLHQLGKCSSTDGVKPGDYCLFWLWYTNNHTEAHAAVAIEQQQEQEQKEEGKCVVVVDDSSSAESEKVPAGEEADMEETSSLTLSSSSPSPSPYASTNLPFATFASGDSKTLWELVPGYTVSKRRVPSASAASSSSSTTGSVLLVECVVNKSASGIHEGKTFWIRIEDLYLKESTGGYGRARKMLKQ